MDKCRNQNFCGITHEHIVTTSMVTAHKLSKEPKVLNFPVYLIGSKVLEEELNKQEVKTIGVGPDPPEKYQPINGVSDLTYYSIFIVSHNNIDRK